MSTPILTFRPEAGGVRVDLDQFVTTRALIQANSGGGKSRMLRYLLEQTHGKIQQIILDPEGEFASLREKFDYLLAGHEGDVPAEAKTAKVLARRLLELNASAVIDLYDLEFGARRHFVRLFLDELMHLPRALWRPLLVVIDEAHVFCPERGAGEAESTGSVISLCTQGRKRGFAAILATQRISKLHKDAAAELLNKLIGRTGLDVDLKRAGDELGFDKETRQSLRDLEPGEFYAFGPAISRSVLKVRGGPILTTHPQPGKIAPPAPPPPAAVQKMVAQMLDLAKQAEAEARTEAELREQLSRAQRRVRELERLSNSQTAIKQPSGYKPEDVQKQIDTAIAAERKRAEGILLEHHRAQSAFTKQMRSQVGAVADRLTKIGRAAEQIVTLSKFEIEEVAAPAKPNGNGGAHTATARNTAPAFSRPSRATNSVSARPPSTGSLLPKGEHAVLTAACQYPDGVTRQQLTILTGYKRSSRDAYIQRLREKGLVEPRGDLVVAAEGAEEHLGDFEPLPTGEALQQYWLDRLPAGERALFQVLLDNYPDGVTREQLSSLTEYKRSSRDAYLQRMSAKKIIEIDGSVVSAADFLFT